MKRLLIVPIALICGVLTTSAQCIQRDEKIEAQVEQILSKMTLEEKVGQMFEIAIDCIAQKSSDNNVKSNKSMQSLANGMLSAEQVNRVFGEFKIGSVLNVPEGLAQKPERWADMVRVLNSASEFQTGIPELYGVDQIHGASYTWGATMFPQEVSQGASFNIQIPKRIGEITAYESRACLIPWVYSPVMDVTRSPLWPRLWESFGEDVLLNAVMATELTKGLQGNDPNHVGMNNVAACLKHYLAYGAATSGKDRTPSNIPYREMMEKHFQPFRMCCEAGALSIMVNSANNSGMPFHANRKLLTEWLKEGLNWDGMIITDWADIDNLWKRDHVAANKKDAICMAINAGIDMTMDPYDTSFCTLLAELVNEGRVPMERIDDAVRRILRLKIRVGLMDRTTWDIPYDNGKKSKKARTLKNLYADFGSDKFAQEATQMAEECMVLLKNDDNILPLAKGKKVFVCGPNANSFRSMNGGWSYTWQGNKTDDVCREIGNYNTFYEAIEKKFGKENVTYSSMVAYQGKNWQDDVVLPEPLNLVEGQKTAMEKAAEADVIIACIGENSYTETVGNISDLTLSRNQLDMVKALANTGKPIILVLNEGRPRLITEIEPLAKAVVHTFLPGNYGGDALANLISGEVNFSGRMPYTYPKHSGSLANYDYKPCENRATMEGAYNYDAKMDVLYTFGQGMSYSDVKVSNLRITNMPKPISDSKKSGKGVTPRSAKGPQFAEDDVIEFTLDVTNNSDRSVKEPILLFISDMVASLTPDVKRLRAFDKISLNAHETKTVTLKVHPYDLSYVDEDMEWILEPGQFRAAVGDQNLIFEIK